MGKYRLNRDEKALLVELNGQKQSVICGDCKAVHQANWEFAISQGREAWLARSSVTCWCGSVLLSFIGPLVPMEKLVRDLDAQGIESRPFTGEPGGVLNCIRRQPSAARH
jgi:hypothetical protein